MEMDLRTPPAYSWRVSAFGQPKGGSPVAGGADKHNKAPTFRSCPGEPWRVRLGLGCSVLRSMRLDAAQADR